MNGLPAWLSGPPDETLPYLSGKPRKHLLDKSLNDFAAFQRQLLMRQSWSRSPGLIQSLDPRLKLATTLAFCLLGAFTHDPLEASILFVLAGWLAGLSGIPPRRFYAWQWLVFPFFSFLAALPAMTAWLTPGEPLAGWGPLVLTRPGVVIALLLALRAAASLAWVMLLISTTTWDQLLRGARALGLPGGAVLAFGIFLGYLLALARRLEEIHFGRLSRLLVREKPKEAYRWLGAAMILFYRITERLGREMGEALEARGYEGEMIMRHGLCWKARDSFALAIATSLIGGCLVFRAL